MGASDDEPGTTFRLRIHAEPPEHEIGDTRVHILPRVEKLRFDERGVLPMPPQPTLRLPASCACCGEPAHGRSVAVPNFGGAGPTHIPACAVCDAHLRPNPHPAVARVSFLLVACALALYLATRSTVAGIALMVVLVIGLTASIVVEQRARKPLPEWPAPRGRHCGPMWILHIGSAGTFRGQHRSWLRRLHALSAPHLDAKTSFDADSRS